MDIEEFLSGGQKTPSVSWKNKPVGTKVAGRVAREPRTMQSLDYDDGTPEFWDPPANTQPKMQMAIYIDLGIHHPDTEKYPSQDGVWALYVRQSTQLHKALKEAVRSSGATGINVGGHISVTYIGDGEQKNAKFNAPKLFKVEYQPPAARATSDFLGGASASVGGGTAPSTASSGAAPAGIDPAAWSNLDDARKAAIYAQMAGASIVGATPPF